MKSARTTMRLLSLPLLVSVSGSALAADVEWDGSDSTNWFDAANWVGGVVPVVADNVIIDTNSPNPTVIDGLSTPLLGNVVLGNANGATGTLTIRNGGDLFNVDGTIAAADNAVGTVTVSGTGSTWTNSGALAVGDRGDGTLLVEDGGSVTSTGGAIADGPNSVSMATFTGVGSTWINNGSLKVGGAFSTGTLLIEDGATVSNTSADIGASDGGEGYVTVTGSGSTWTNSGAISFGSVGSGWLTISDGGLVTSAGGVVGDSAGYGSVTVTGAGSTWNNSGDLEIASRGGSEGDLTVSAGGTVTNANGSIGDAGFSSGWVLVTGAGSVWTNNGNLDIGTAEGADGTLTIADGGVVNVSGNVMLTPTSGSADTDGVINIGAAPGDSATGPGTLNAPTIDFGAGRGTINFNHTDETGDYVFAPAMTSTGGTSTIAHHAGFTRLTGDSSGFTGVTDIHGGTLTIETMLGGTVNVLDGGMLGGAGTATGDIAFDPAASYLVEMDGTSNPQGLTVNGTATLAGTVLLDGNYAAITGMGNVAILTTQSPLLSAFDVLQVVNPSIFLTPALAYDDDGLDDDHVYVSVAQTTAFADVAETPNQASTAEALDALPPGNPLFDAVALMDSADTARDAFSQLSGEVHAALKKALIENSQQAVRAANGRIHDVINGENGNEFNGGIGDRSDPLTGIWMTGVGNWMNTDATGNAAEMDNNFGGVLAGIDRGVGDYGRIGVLGGYSRANVEVDALGSQADADSYTVGLYGGADNGNAVLSLGALYNWHSIGTTRQVTNPVMETLTADYNARSYQFFAEAGVRASMDGVTFEPFAGVSHVGLHTDAFTETGGVAALSSPSQTTSTTFTDLGLRSSVELASNVSVRSKVGWRHAFGDVDPASTLTIAGSAPFSILGAPIDRDAATVEAGIDIRASEKLSVGASYEGQFGNNSTANGFNAWLQWAF